MGLGQVQDLLVDPKGLLGGKPSPPPLPFPVAEVEAPVQGALVGLPLAEVVVGPSLPVKGKDPPPQGKDRGLGPEELHRARISPVAVAALKALLPPERLRRLTPLGGFEARVYTDGERVYKVYRKEEAHLAGPRPAAWPGRASGAWSSP